MKPFSTLKAVAAPLEMINVDTDIIIPKQFLKTVKRTGLGVNAFYNIRYDDDGAPLPDFVLNKPEYTEAEILITGENFGCGSSREHAPWALLDMGFRCIVAPSFADIFFNNSFKNGILPIELPQYQVDQLMGSAKNDPDGEIEIDLEKQTITRGNKFTFAFDIDPFRKYCLLNGLDDIGLTLGKGTAIDNFEDKRTSKQPWM
ncbi:MAG TPA: 3-isopropylmalate dehydratase small subunit [Alphaproteobacteria bacterium]|nr:3-isopropylmalate dehydratase small subunit [Alphaproteobacteria bacterium]USO06430.1 MAG: 3-isopropylmalate dehydratase small subunit [Rhodospirillales bacterium]HOO82594.1 3-isopropylmalate dehydratase small subunit [Alphaproteobacteria bacterium]